MFKRSNSHAFQWALVNFIFISPKYRLRDGSGAEFAPENLNRVNVIGRHWVFLDVFMYYKGTSRHTEIRNICSCRAPYFLKS